MYACLAVTCHLHFWQNDQGLLHATAVNTKITSRTCRFETCRYLQLPNFKLRLISWERVTYSILFHKVIKVLLPLSLSLTHACMHAHTQRHRINTQFAWIQKLAVRQTVKSQELFFRQYSYCLQTLGITCIAYSFSPLHEVPDIFRHFMKCLTSQIAYNIYK